MAAPSSSSCEVVDLSLAAISDDETSQLFFSKDGGGHLSWPAAAEIESKLKKQKKLLALCDRHGVPRELKPLCAATLGCAACETPPQGSNALCVYSDALEAGLRFPLHDFYLKLLRHYRLAPSQLVPNAWKYMAAFVLRCKEAGVEPLVSAFRYFFSVCAHKRKDKPSGWHHFKPCTGRHRLFSGTLLTRQGWKSRFFFLKSPEGMPWKCQVAWGKPRMEDARTVEATDAAIDKLKQMPCIEFNDLLSLHTPPVAAPTLMQLYSTPVPMVKPECAVASARAQDLTSLDQLHATLEAGAAAASAADATSEGEDLMWQTRRKRSCPGPDQASMTVTDISAVPPRQGMEMPPCETSFDDGPWGNSAISMPPGIYGSDALYMYDAMVAIDAEKARLRDEQQARDAKAAQEIAHLQGQLQQAVHREQWANAAIANFMDYMDVAAAENAQLKEKYASEIAKLNQEHASEVAMLQDEHHKASTAHAEMAKAEYMAEIAKLQEKHAAEVAKLNQALAHAEKAKAEYKAEIAKLQEKHAAEVAKLNNALTHAEKAKAEYTAKIAKLQEKHAAEVAKLNQALSWLKEEHAVNIARMEHAAEEAADVVHNAKKDIVLSLFPDLDASLL